MRAILYSVLARLRDFLRPGAGDADFDEELGTHLAIAEAEHRRTGMSREEARRRARLELGNVVQLRESARAVRGLPWLETFWLDARLGVRMLRKSWGLTLVGGMAMAITIGLGASIITIWNTFSGTRLPLDEGERVVAIQLFDKASQQLLGAPPADFQRWRDAVTSVEQVSAMRSIAPRVITPNGDAGAVPAAEVTAAAFQVARVPPILGRPLLELDERPGAEPVAVIGASLWRSGFASDPNVLGQRVQIDDTPHIIVGVMPADFRFPVNQRLWIPLHAAAPVRSATESRVFVFGRLASGATFEQAQGEMTTLGVLPSPPGTPAAHGS